MISVAPNRNFPSRECEVKAEGSESTFIAGAAAACLRANPGAATISAT